MEDIKKDIEDIKRSLHDIMPVVAKTSVEVEQINSFISGTPKFKQKGIAERMETVENWKWYLIVAAFLGGSGGIASVIKMFS